MHRNLTRRLAFAGTAALLLGLVGAGRVAVEAGQEARGQRAPTWAATRIIARPEARQGALAARMAAPTGPAPRGADRRRAMLWAAPTTVVGALLGLMTGGRWEWREDIGAWLVQGTRNPLLRLGSFAGQGIGHVIISRRDPCPPRLLVHEAAHVRQAEVLGPATLPAYFWWLARHGYRQHPMERGARATTRAWVEARRG